MHTGYIKLWRKFKETSFFKNPNAAHLAIYLLLECNHEPKKRIWNNEEITINKGQCLTGRQKISFDTGLSEQETRTAIAILKNVGFLTSKSTNRFTLITIDKYGDYQEISTSKSTNKQPTSNQQATTPYTLKNDKNDKNTDTAQAEPGAEIVGNPPVNWDNCRSDLQRFITYYVKVEFPELYQTTTTKQATGIFKRYGKAGSEILSVAGDLDTAKAAFDSARAYFMKQGLSWNLSTVAKNCGEFINEAIRGRK